jgi:hypothetical protein
MWKCPQCGEEDNESNFKFCIACGNPRSADIKNEATKEEVDSAFQIFSTPSLGKNREESSTHGSITDREWTMPKSLTNFRDRIKSVITAKSDEVNHIHISPDAQEKLNKLVEAGVFDSQPEAAAYLIEEGIKTQDKLFEAVEQKLMEIERLHSELRNLVKDRDR